MRRGHDAAATSAVVIVCVFGLTGCVPGFGGFTIEDPEDGSVGRDGGGDRDAGASATTDAGARDGGAGADSGVDRDAGPPVDRDAGSIPECPVRPLPCLDAAPANVIEIPSEAGGEAFGDATFGDTIQVRALNLSSTYWVPSGVTLRGCEGATITGTVAFEGSSGTVEGFSVTGEIVANRSGVFTVRDNRVGPSTLGSARVEGRSVDALVAANVRLVVERNTFTDVPVGVGARTTYDTMVHAVTIDVRNNVFDGVDRPVRVEEGGIVGAIEATVRYNTLVDFMTGVSISDVDAATTIVEANLFGRGSLGVSTDSPWEGGDNLGWMLDTPFNAPPIDGALTALSGDPFRDLDGGDLRLAPGSEAIDRVPASDVDDDQRGCPRPVSFSGGSELSDVGALEAYP
jgi:hypothetical protein